MLVKGHDFLITSTPMSISQTIKPPYHSILNNIINNSLKVYNYLKRNMNFRYQKLVKELETLCD